MQLPPPPLSPSPFILSPGGGEGRVRGGGEEVLPDLSVVIVSYNVEQYLAACLESLPAGTGGLSVEVFVVDNASPDGSAELVARRFPDVRLLVNRENVGFARAVNRALALTRGRYALLLDPDTVVPAGALTRLVKVADRSPEIGLVGPALHDPATGELQPSFRQFPSWRSAFSHYTLAKPFLRLRAFPPWRPVVDRPTADGWLIGACLLIRRDLLNAIGGLDEGYFLFCEDTDYCRRAIRAKRRLLYTHETSVLHHEGKSAEQERPSAMRLAALRSLLYYLEGDRPGRARVLKPLFKVCFLASLFYQCFESGVKAGLYALAARREQAAKHRRRLARNADFLGRFTVRFLAL